MMLFSIGTGLEHVGDAGLDPDCLRAGMLASGSSGLKQDRVGVSIDLVQLKKASSDTKQHLQFHLVTMNRM